MIKRRWPNGVECPRCGSRGVLFLEKYDRWHCRTKHPPPQFTLERLDLIAGQTAEKRLTHASLTGKERPEAAFYRKRQGSGRSR